MRPFLLLAGWTILTGLSGCREQPVPGPVAAGPATSPAAVSREPPATTASRRSARPTAVPRVQPRFLDVAASAGIAFTFFSDAVPGRLFLPEVMGGGAAWIDVDADGWLDLYLRDGNRLHPADGLDPSRTSRLYRNSEGDFQEVTAPSRSGRVAYGQGCAVGDFDGDGFADLYLADYGSDALLHNQGDGTFLDVTGVAGVSDADWSSSAVWIDVNDDGLLDLYVVNYMGVNWSNHQTCEFAGKPGYCGPGNFDAQPDRLYVNQGTGAFVESAAALGCVGEDGNGLAVVAADLDDDARFEVYVANDMSPKFLFTRSTTHDPPGAPRKLFTEAAIAAGCALSDAGVNEAGMGIACADYDGDGRMDLFLTHYYHMKNTLYHNRGGLVFDDDSRRTRIAAASFESLGFGTVAIDYDRDGDPDLFVANGHVLGPDQFPNAMRPQLLENTGGVFADVSDHAGPYFQELWLGRGAASADYDNDGDLDLAVTHLDRPFVLLRNDTRTGEPFLGLQLETPSRIPPTGGRVVVQSGEQRQTIPVTAGGSYLCSSDSRLLIGLPGARSSADVRLEVYWPSGRVDRFEAPPLNRYLRLVEGGALEELRLPRLPADAESERPL